VEAALVVLVIALLGATGGNVVLARAVLRPKNAPVTTVPYPVPTEDLDLRMHTLTDDMARLTIAVSEGIARVDRHEKRVQKTVTSARRLVREAGLEHAGIEAESEELQSAHDEGVEPLPAMPAQVAETRTIRIPGGHLEVAS